MEPAPTRAWDSKVVEVMGVESRIEFPVTSEPPPRPAPPAERRRYPPLALRLTVRSTGPPPEHARLVCGASVFFQWHTVHLRGVPAAAPRRYGFIRQRNSGAAPSFCEPPRCLHARVRARVSTVRPLRLPRGWDPLLSALRVHVNQIIIGTDVSYCTEI